MQTNRRTDVESTSAIQQMISELGRSDASTPETRELREDRIALAIRVFEALGIEPVQHTRSSWLSH